MSTRSDLRFGRRCEFELQVRPRYIEISFGRAGLAVKFGPLPNTVGSSLPVRQNSDMVMV